MLSKNVFLIFALMLISSFSFAQNFGAPSYSYDTEYVAPNDDYEGLVQFGVRNMVDTKNYFVLPNKFSNILTAHVEGEPDITEYFIDADDHEGDVDLWTSCTKGNQNQGAYFLKLYEDDGDTIFEPDADDPKKDTVTVGVDLP